MTDLQIWVCVENNVVMMTASTPALKPLFRRKSEGSGSINSYYNKSYEIGDTGRSGTVGSAGRSRSRNDRKRQSDVAMICGDTQSEEHILAIDQDNIRKTTEVHASYDDGRIKALSLGKGHESG